MGHLALLDIFGHRAHGIDEIVNQLLSLTLAHQAKEIARLRVIVVALTVIVAVRVTADLTRRLFDSRVFHRPAETIWLVVHRTAVVAVESHDPPRGHRANAQGTAAG